MPFSLAATLFLLGQTPAAPPLPPVVPTPVVKPAARPDAKAAAPRVDLKKPYIRVWYWPPTPAQDGTSTVTVTEANGTTRVVQVGDKIDPVRFPTNRSKVVDETEALRSLAAWMNGNPGTKITLDGYADPRGSKAHNKKLAESRAKAVRDFLVDAGVSKERIAVASHGASNPVKGETQEETYWLSRRVSIRFESAPVAPKPPAAASAKAETKAEG